MTRAEVSIYTMLLAFLCACGCGNEIDPTPGPPGSPNFGCTADPDHPSGDCILWTCQDAPDQYAGKTHCEAPQPPARHAGGNYTCDSGGQYCPPTGSGGSGSWSCSAGAQQLICERGGSGTLSPPNDCTVSEWKTYFCAMAQQVVDQHNISYRIDCSQVSDTGGQEPLPNGVQCAEVVTALQDLETRVRNQAWAAYGPNAAQCAQSDLVGKITAWCDSVINQVMANAPICH